MSTKNSFSYAEYIWLDGAQPVANLRSKTRVIQQLNKPSLDSFPEWSYDGSSTYQATGDKSDLALKPVYFTNDPLRGEGNYLVLCEVFDASGQVIPTNTRAALREIMLQGGKNVDAYIGFEQEYTLLQNGRPLGFPTSGYPAPQGPYYCSVGATRAYGRDIIEEHLSACSNAGLAIYGINAEVMPGQWEFQMGYRGISGEAADPLTISDHLWLGRYLLDRIAEKHGVDVSFSCKPMTGDWNGAGMHTNFSTQQMRSSSTGRKAIEDAVTALSKRHNEHIAQYGSGLELRLTGHHETCHITEFKSGVSHRGASIRIPLATSKNGCGYIEDRRPGANADPYRVARMLMETICGISVR